MQLVLCILKCYYGVHFYLYFYNYCILLEDMNKLLKKNHATKLLSVFQNVTMEYVFIYIYIISVYYWRI